MVKAIHTGTTVRFMANGQLSEAKPVTSGIRQRYPLAPLLFIMAADLLCDEINGDQRLQSIALDSKQPQRQLKIAGYANDTAIYISTKNMQIAAIRAVERISKVSGLKLNVIK